MKAHKIHEKIGILVLGTKWHNNIEKELKGESERDCLMWEWERVCVLLMCYLCCHEFISLCMLQG